MCVLPACMYVQPMEVRRGNQIPATRVQMVVSHHVGGCLGLEPGPLEEQPALLITEPPLQPSHNSHPWTNLWI